MKVAGKLAFFLVEVDDAEFCWFVVSKFSLIDVAEMDGTFDSPYFGLSFVLFVPLLVVDLL